MSVELHDDFVQLCALAQGFYARGLGVSVDLSNGFVPLLLGSGFGVALVKHLEFKNVTVLRGVVRQVGQEEEVAEAVVQLQLRRSVVISVEIEISHKEALQVALCFNAVAHR